MIWMSWWSVIGFWCSSKGGLWLSLPRNGETRTWWRRSRGWGTMLQNVNSSEEARLRKIGWRWRPLGVGLRELTLLPAILLAILLGSFIHGAFLTTGNFLNILQQSSELAVLVLALSIILID